MKRFFWWLASFFLPPWHSPEEVGRRLVEGLRDGSLVLDGEEE